MPLPAEAGIPVAVPRRAGTRTHPQRKSEPCTTGEQPAYKRNTTAIQPNNNRTTTASHGINRLDPVYLCANLALQPPPLPQQRGGFLPNASKCWPSAAREHSCLIPRSSVHHHPAGMTEYSQAYQRWDFSPMALSPERTAVAAVVSGPFVIYPASCAHLASKRWAILAYPAGKAAEPRRSDGITPQILVASVVPLPGIHRIRTRSSRRRTTRPPESGPPKQSARICKKAVDKRVAVY
jgi:hypothetical protein